MNKKINELAEQLRQEIIKESSDRTVFVSLNINFQGCNFEIEQRTPYSLKMEGISMRNLKGVFIK